MTKPILILSSNSYSFFVILTTSPGLENLKFVVFDTEKFEMLKNSIEKIMNDKKFKENEVVFIPFDEMLEITHDKMTITLKEIEGVIVLNNTNTTNLRFSILLFPFYHQSYST